MNSKNFKAIFFILIFLVSKVGLALNIHYCGGHIAEIELAWNVEGCGMFSEKIEDKGQDICILKKHCCTDETIFIQNNEPQKATNSDFKISSLFISINDLYSIDNINITFPKILYLSSKCLIPKRKIYLLNQCLIFYG